MNFLLKEEDYLCHEIIPKLNAEIILEEFKILNDLEGESDPWESFGDYDEYFNTRPIGKRLLPTEELKIPSLEIFDLAKKNNLEQFHLLKVDESSRMINESTLSHTIGFGTEKQGIFFTIENNIIKNIWIDTWIWGSTLPLIPFLIELGNKYNLILILWYGQKIIDLKNNDTVIKKFILGDI